MLWYDEQLHQKWPAAWMIRQAATTGQDQILLGLWVFEQPFCPWPCEPSLTASAAGLLTHCQAPLPPAYRQASLCLSRLLVVSSDESLSVVCVGSSLHVRKAQQDRTESVIWAEVC